MRIAAVFIALTILLTGCASIDSDELFRVPKTPGDFLKLQEKIDALLSSGGEYAPPVSGNNRQVQQTVDLTGSGVYEVLVFLRFQGESPLRIYIFHLEGSDFIELDVISEDAENIDSVHYADLNGDGIPEILVGWRVGMLKTLSVYTLEDNQIVELLSTNYSELCVFDILANGRNDLLVLRHDASTFTGNVQLYYFENGEILSFPQAQMSKNVQGITRIKSGLLIDGTPALYVASKLDQNAIVTDVFTVRGGHFYNVSLNPESEISDETLRYSRLYASDLDGDGVVELPQIFPLPGYMVESDNTDFYYVEWRNYDSYGRISPRVTTYHSQSDGWYIRLPDTWKAHFTVTARNVTPTIRSTTLAYFEEDYQDAVDICVIYSFTGNNRKTHASREGRIILSERNDAIFAAELLPGAESVYNLTRETLSSLFKLMENKWITGEIED